MSAKHPVQTQSQIDVVVKTRLWGFVSGTQASQIKYDFLLLLLLLFDSIQCPIWHLTLQTQTLRANRTSNMFM